MPQGFARVTIKAFGRPIRVREPQPCHSELNASLIEIGEHLQFLRRCHAAEALDLLGVDFFFHGTSMIASAAG